MPALQRRSRRISQERYAISAAAYICKMISVRLELLIKSIAQAIEFISGFGNEQR